MRIPFFVPLAAGCARLITVFAPNVENAWITLNKKGNADVRYCMSAIFFKRLGLALCALVSVTVCVMALALPQRAANAHKSVYFVIEQTDSIAASSGQITLRGGAGYCMNDCVAFGVYFAFSDAERVEEKLRKEYASVEILPLELALQGEEGTFAYTVIRIVDGWTQVLQKGGRQSVVRAGLEETLRILSYKAKQVDGGLLTELAEPLKRLLESSLYVGDLRYYTCFACERLYQKGQQGYF